MYSYDFRSAFFQAKASVKKPLYGHDDMNSAYVVDDYPYGFRLRTQIRYWLEYKPRKGFRFVSQTLNPKTQRWNKPKASTYAMIAGCMYLDSQDHVKWDGLTEYSDYEKTLDFVKSFPRADKRVLKVWVPKKIKHYEDMLDGQAHWTINKVRKEPTEDDLGDYRKEVEAWTAIDKKL